MPNVHGKKRQVLTSVVFTPTGPVDAFVGDAIQFTAQQMDAAGRPMAVPVALTWVSSVPSVGTVDTSGKVTVVGEGDTVIGLKDSAGVIYS